MKISNILKASLILLTSTTFSNINADEKPLPEKMLKIMQQPKYQHSTWGFFAKNAETGQVLYDIHSDEMFLPASTTKLFSVAALLKAYGDDFRFKTPVYLTGEITNGKLKGNLVLVAQGDLTMGGRQIDSDMLAFTKLDHINANQVPGAILTPQDPLLAFNNLAKQIHEKGIKEINGNVFIDENLFQTTEKRGMMVSPIMLNENLIDIVLNPTSVGTTASFSWRPKVEGYSVKNEVKTVATSEKMDLKITSDEAGKNIVVQGTIPMNQKNVLRTFSIKDPNDFARAAFIQSLGAEGITVNIDKIAPKKLSKEIFFEKKQPIAIWTSPPLSEYGKLILKVSHNLGANLVPLLLASQKGQKTFDEGMKLLGNFVIEDVKISPDAFVFIDGAGGDENRVTPQSEVQLLEYVKKLPSKQFTSYMNSLPILGVDGSLEDFGKTTNAVGKVYAKTGTGVSYNLATNKYFLTTQALGGYIEGKNGQLILYMLAVNNGQMPTIEDIFPIFEDLCQVSSVIYELSE
ncbi:MAG: D-alanyl-D-alanine carboxypeptidase/D-alanyl-D-alanine-endopeptidase [Parachlamydiaceae bacterium]|nr:D-alanyl-D-alanine carboxypeptidase/D-alanyl-D-alanine-endopeptidase [Parachlamydiaceae bacterium]